MEGMAEVVALQLTPGAAHLVVLALHMVVTERAGTHVDCIPARGAILQQAPQHVMIILTAEWLVLTPGVVGVLQVCAVTGIFVPSIACASQTRAMLHRHLNSQ